MLVESEWRKLWKVNSHREVFGRLFPHFQTILDETYFMCIDYVPIIIGDKERIHENKNKTYENISIMIPRFGTMGGVNGPVVLFEIDKSMHKSSVVNFL